VAECIAAGELAPGEPTELAITIWAHVHGLVSLRIAGNLSGAGDEAAFAALFTRSVDRLLAGLAP
jgi:hypothetical protein